MEAKLPQEQATLRTAIAILADPTQIDTIEAPTVKAAQTRGRVFGAMRNVVKLFILMGKENLKK